jgi:pimeloyl-ACP methyl ester carboxylesterase
MPFDTYTPEEIFKMFMTPGRPAPRARREQELADQGTPLTLQVWNHTIRGHQWSPPAGLTTPVEKSGTAKKVLVQHGWGSRSTAMWAIINALLNTGFEVIGFDAIGNGDSDGEESTMLHFAETVSEIGANHGPFHAVIGHSIGATCLPLALTKKLQAERVVLISPRDQLTDFLTRFLEVLNADPDMFGPVSKLWNSKIGWERVMQARPSELARNFLQPCLIIHDKDDEDVNFHDSEIIYQAWSGAQLHLTDGLGHARIVRSKEVASLIAEFLSEHHAKTAPC